MHGKITEHDGIHLPTVYTLQMVEPFRKEKMAMVFVGGPNAVILYAYR